MTSNQTEKHLEKKDLQRMFRRSLKTGWAWHYERQMHLGFEYMMEPILRKLYGEGTPKYKDALVRHLEFFNCTHQLIPFSWEPSVSLAPVSAALWELQATGWAQFCSC